MGSDTLESQVWVDGFEFRDPFPLRRASVGAVPGGRDIYFGDLQKEAKALCLIPAKCASVRGGELQ